MKFVQDIIRRSREKLAQAINTPVEAEETVVEETIEEAAEGQSDEVGSDDGKNNPEVDIALPRLTMLIGCQQQDCQVEENDNEFCDTSDKVHKFFLLDSVEIRI